MSHILKQWLQSFNPGWTLLSPCRQFIAGSGVSLYIHTVYPSRKDAFKAKRRLSNPLGWTVVRVDDK